MTFVKPTSPRIEIIVDHEDDISNRPISNTEVVHEMRKIKNEINLIAATEKPKGTICKNIGSKFYAIFVGTLTLLAAVIPIWVTLSPSAEIALSTCQYP